MSDEETSNPSEEKESQYNNLMITATPEFKAAMKVAAEEKDMSISAFARSVLAAAIGYTGPLQKETSRKKKYATEEERAAAMKARGKSRRDVIKALLEKYSDEYKAALDTEEAPTE